MHPDRRFAITSDALLVASVIRWGVVHLFASTSEGPMVAHVPVVFTEHDTFRFHLSRNNRLTKHLHGAQVIASAMGDNGYVSPDWYANTHNQVPTWNYSAVEIEGSCTKLDDAQLLQQVEALSADQESRLRGKAPWTMDKMDIDARDRLLRGIVGFELAITAMRGTYKMSQNKSLDDRLGIVAALRQQGKTGLAASISTFDSKQV